MCVHFYDSVTVNMQEQHPSIRKSTYKQTTVETKNGMLFACNMKEALARAVILMTLREITNSVTAGLSVANEIPRTLPFTKAESGCRMSSVFNVYG